MPPHRPLSNDFTCTPYDDGCLPVAVGAGRFVAVNETRLRFAMQCRLANCQCISYHVCHQRLQHVFRMALNAMPFAILRGARWQQQFLVKVVAVVIRWIVVSEPTAQLILSVHAHVRTVLLQCPLSLAVPLLQAWCAGSLLAALFCLSAPSSVC